MSQVKTIFENVSWVMISQTIVSILGFVWTIMIARYLGVNDYGILGFATSIVSLLGITQDLGITNYSIRQIATDNNSAKKYLGNIIPLKLLLSLGTFGILSIALILMKSDETTITITLLFLVEGIFQTIMGTLNGTFQAFEKGKYQGITNLILNISLFIFIILSIFTDLGLLGIVGSYILANIIGFIYEYYTLNKLIVKPKFEFDRSFCKKLIRVSFPFAVTGILYSIYYSIDVVMLTNISGDYATGLYNATYKLISVLTIIYSMYTTVIYPEMSKFFKDDKGLLKISYEKSIKYVSIVMAPLAIATMIYSSDIINLIYGQEFDAAAPLLSILIWTAFIIFINSPGNTLLNASHKEVTVTKIYGLAAIFNIMMNFILIPYLSYIGAALTTVLSDILIFSLQKYVIHKNFENPDKKFYLDLGKIVIGSIFLGGILYILNLNMWIAIPIGIIIYLITIILFKVFDDDDKYIIKEILGKNKT